MPISGYSRPRTGSRSIFRSERTWIATVLPAVFAALLLVQPVRAQVLGDVVDRTIESKPVPVVVAAKMAAFGIVSDPVTSPFTGVVVEARSPSGYDVTAEIRFIDDDIRGPWLPMRIVRSATEDALIAGYRSEDVRSDVHFEIRMAVPEGQTVHIGQAGTFDSRLDQDRQPVPDGLDPLPAAADGTITPPPLVTRAKRDRLRGG